MWLYIGDGGLMLLNTVITGLEHNSLQKQSNGWISFIFNLFVVQLQVNGYIQKGSGAKIFYTVKLYNLK